MSEMSEKKWSLQLKVFAVIAALIVGTLIGFGIDKALASESSARQAPTCGDSCVSKVRSKRQGVRKYKNNALGHKGNTNYSPRVKRKIKKNLYQAYRRHSARGEVPVAARQQIEARGGSTKSYLWRRFKAVDSCGYQANPRGSGTWSRWTCDTEAPKINNQLSRDEIRGIVCFTVAGAAVPAVIVSAPVGGSVGWSLLGIGAGAAGCTWGPMLEKMGHR
jgi:hypothetical protein